jgi:hypothetical protein
MNEQPKVTTFTCPTEGCAQPVIYRPRKSVNLQGYERPSDTGARVVYLTCPHGHTHPFELGA